MSLIDNERLKLAANYANGLALAVAIVGFLQPFLGADWSATSLIRGLICLLVSLLLHLGGQAILGGLKE